MLLDSLVKLIFLFWGFICGYILCYFQASDKVKKMRAKIEEQEKELRYRRINNHNVTLDLGKAKNEETNNN